MKNRIMVFAVALVVLAGMTAWAGAQAKKYQVTGPVVKVEDGKVTVQKGDENWEIAIDKDTKVTGELKVGAKVTIEYQMFATSVTVKDAGAKEKDK